MSQLHNQINDGTRVPGYTGHIPTQEIQEDMIQNLNSCKSQIPGYAGYITGVKSENVYGKTFGKTTYMSATNQIQRGYELRPEKKFESTFQDEFKNQNEIKLKENDRIRNIEQAKQTLNNIDSYHWSLDPIQQDLQRLSAGQYLEAQLENYQQGRVGLTYDEACKTAYHQIPQKQ